MKKFLVFLFAIGIGTAVADTINLHWLNYDGTNYQNSTCTVDGDLVLPSTPPTRYGYTFTGWKFANYMPIEYLESTGTQYIDTGVYPEDVISIQIGIKVSNNITFFGSSISESQRFDAGLHTVNGLFLDYGRGDGYGRIIGSEFIAQKYYNLEFGNTYIKDLNTNNILATGSHYNFSKMNLPMFLFTQNKNGNPVLSYNGCQLYYFKIYHNNTLVRDFIPVLNSNGTPCMFDKVEGKFYYNAGTGNFIAGPALQ